MPAKRVIILDRDSTGAAAYRAVLWADVPAGNQIAYANPSATSVYLNISSTELQAIRNGLVAEREELYVPSSGSPTLNDAQTYFQTAWTAFQALITAETGWADYGRYWNSSSVWNASPGIPSINTKPSVEGLPSFVAITPVTAFAANRFHLVLFNGASSVVSQSTIVKIRLIAVLPSTTVVTGVLSSAWTINRRTGLTTNPSGTGSVTVGHYDSAQTLPSGIGVWAVPQTAPAGGTTTEFGSFVPQSDELKLTTADAATLATVFSSFGGQVVYNSRLLNPTIPLTIRPGQTLEVQQGATAGTGNVRIMCVFTVG